METDDVLFAIAVIATIAVTATALAKGIYWLERRDIAQRN